MRFVLEAHARNLDAWRDRIRDACVDKPIRPITQEEVPFSAIGHAVSAHLGWSLTRAVPAVAERLAASLGGVASDVIEFARTTAPSDLDEIDAARASWWVGQLDRLGRHRRPDDPDLAVLDATDSLAALMAAAPGAWLDDVMSVVAHNRLVLDELARADYSPLTCDPAFTGSPLVGGADADLIAGSTLVEIKTTLDRRPRLRDVHQMLGYLLLDFDDEYQLDRIALWSARYGALAVVPASEHIDDLAAARAAMRATLEADGPFDHDMAEALRAEGYDPTDLGKPPTR
jgi:hypothetical protein